MKKLLTTAALVGITALSFGQGQVTFNNGATTQISTNSAHNGAAAGPTAAIANGTFYYALFVAPSTVTTDLGVSDVRWTFAAYATNTSAGRFLGGQPVLPTPYASGTTADFLVRGWSANIGSDWASAQSWESAYETTGFVSSDGYFGSSVVGQIVVGGPPAGVPALFGLNAGQLQGFTLDARPTLVPEPSTFALAGLGMAAMLIFRRRKAKMMKQLA